MNWPSSELEYWSVFLSITDKDKPIVKPDRQKQNAESISVEASKAKFRMLFE